MRPPPQPWSFSVSQSTSSCSLSDTSSPVSRKLTPSTEPARAHRPAWAGRSTNHPPGRAARRGGRPHLWPRTPSTCGAASRAQRGSRGGPRRARGGGRSGAHDPQASWFLTSVTAPRFTCARAHRRARARAAARSHTSSRSAQPHKRPQRGYTSGASCRRAPHPVHALGHGRVGVAEIGPARPAHAPCMNARRRATSSRGRRRAGARTGSCRWPGAAGPGTSS
jgi:hypothetical protein